MGKLSQLFPTWPGESGQLDSTIYYLIGSRVLGGGDKCLSDSLGLCDPSHVGWFPTCVVGLSVMGEATKLLLEQLRNSGATQFILEPLQLESLNVCRLLFLGLCNSVVGTGPEDGISRAAGSST